MRISTKGRGIIRAQQGAVARPNPKENYKLPEDQRYQAQTRGMKDFAIEWYKERAKQPKYQSQVNESNLANITDQINRAEYVEPSKFYSNPNVYKGKVGNVTQAAQVAMRQNKGAAYPAGLQYTYNAPSFPFSGRFGDVSWHEGTNKIATEQYLINLAGGGTNTPTKCATRDRVEFFGLETNDNYANNQLVKEEDIQLSTFQYNFNIHVSITNSGLTSKSYDFVADVYIDGVPDGFITIPRSGTLDYQGATFFDRNFHFDLPTDLTNVSKLLFTGYFSTYRVTVDADSVTNNAVCQSGVTTEIPINQAYIGGDTANISINVII